MNQDPIMTTCPHCHRPLDDPQAPYCAGCGRHLEPPAPLIVPAVCPRCHRPIEDATAPFCPGCGKQLRRTPFQPEQALVWDSIWCVPGGIAFGLAWRRLGSPRRLWTTAAQGVLIQLLLLAVGYVRGFLGGGGYELALGVGNGLALLWTAWQYWGLYEANGGRIGSVRALWWAIGLTSFRMVYTTLLIPWHL